jgi:hypothetical protein
MNSAKKVAEEVAGFENRIADLKTEIKTELAGVRGELSLVKWMVGFNLAMTAALLVRLFLGDQ